jgi:hypothetical protein
LLAGNVDAFLRDGFDGDRIDILYWFGSGGSNLHAITG